MNRADRAASFSLFKYQPPVYSIGDRLYVAFEFADEDELRRALGPVGLEGVADLKVGSERIPLEGRELLAEILGPAVTLEVGPEDRYEHLTEPDFAWAELLSAVVALSLAAFRDLRLPCLFQPHRALEDALERCRGGEPPDGVAADLLDVMLREAERSLERAGDARRFLPARLRTRPEVVTRLLLTEAARAALASAGILRLP